MATAQKTTRNLRPRVLSAVLRLQTFTVQEIVTAAELDDRKQAYAQLGPLEAAGLIASTPLPDQQVDHRPAKLYSISAHGNASRRLAEELADYGFVAPQGDEHSRNAAIERGGRKLDIVERYLSSFEPAKINEKRELGRAVSNVKEWGDQLNLVEIDLETARLESEGIKDSDRMIGTLSLRLRGARNSIQKMEERIRRHQSIFWIKTLVENWTDTISDPVRWASKLLKPAQGHPPVELVLDLLSTGLHKRELMPALLTSHAIRTNDVQLIRTCFTHLWKNESRWNRYNHANLNFLLGNFNEAYAQWREVYPDLSKEETPLIRNCALGIFVCEPSNLSQSALRPLLKKYELSIVSPRTLDFWNWDEEVVRPLFVDPISEACNDAGPLTSTVALTDDNLSGPLWALFAYGPLTAIIRQWPGAPPLRVAASVDKLTHEEVDTVRIADALRQEKCVVILEKQGIGDPNTLFIDLETALGQVEKIASVGASAEQSY